MEWSREGREARRNEEEGRRESRLIKVGVKEETLRQRKDVCYLIAPSYLILLRLLSTQILHSIAV